MSRLGSHGPGTRPDSSEVGWVLKGSVDVDASRREMGCGAGTGPDARARRSLAFLKSPAPSRSGPVFPSAPPVHLRFRHHPSLSFLWAFASAVPRHLGCPCSTSVANPRCPLRPQGPRGPFPPQDPSTPSSMVFRVTACVTATTRPPAWLPFGVVCG